MKKTYGLLNEEERELLNRLVAGMTKEQLLWISGYLAGKSEVVGVVAEPGLPDIQVLYGTHSGNSEFLAGELVRQGKAKGLNIEASIMEKFDARLARNLKNLLIIVSTHGEGDPPANAAAFLEYLEDQSTPDLNDLNFAVLGLGDKTYANFSQAGVSFHNALLKRQAKAILPLRKCDAEFMPEAKLWIADILNSLSEELIITTVPETKQPLSAIPGFASTQLMSAPSFKRVFDRSNPFYAEVLKKQLLSGEGSNKQVYHFELSLKGSGFSFLPGDTISIVGDNPPVLVDSILALKGYAKDEEVVLDKKVFPLYVALRNRLEITVLNSAVLENYNRYARSEALSDLMHTSARLADYLYGSDLLDLLTDFPCNLSAQELVSGLRQLPPRKYSIASSLDAFPGEVHITVAALRFKHKNRLHEGAVSSFVADRVRVGDKVPVFVQKNSSFKMPENHETPLIMIGPGTGIAPFRGFLQQRRHLSLKGGTWLFFGDQHEKDDFLYADELLEFKNSGYLSHLDLAFSRDQEEKVYVQHRLLEKREQLWAWIEKGAAIFVCGDKKHMATDVHLALLDVLRSEGRMDINSAKQYLNRLASEKRYQKDVY